MSKKIIFKPQYNKLKYLFFFGEKDIKKKYSRFLFGKWS